MSNDLSARGAEPRVLADSASPSRRSRTKTALLAGGVSANALAQGVLVVCRVFGYEPPVSEVELATLVSLVVALVAMWYQREAVSKVELEARHARDAVESASGRGMGGLLAVVLLLAAPAAAQEVVNPRSPEEALAWQWGPADEALREEVPEVFGLEAAPPVPAVTLAAGGPIYFARVGFNTCDPSSSAGPAANPFVLPMATFPSGQLNLDAPGVCDRLRPWNGVGCGSLHQPWRQTCSEHGRTGWGWACTGKVGRWVLAGARCGQETLRAAFEAAFGRPWLGGDSEERLAVLASCGVVVPGCVLPGCPPPMPPRLDPDPCATPPVPPIPPDPEPEDPPPVEPPACPGPPSEPTPARLVVEVDGCQAGTAAGRWVVIPDGAIESWSADAQQRVKFRPGLRSTGQLSLEEVELRLPACRQVCSTCPPPPTCEVCEEDPPPPPPPPPPTGAVLEWPEEWTSGPPCSGAPDNRLDPHRDCPQAVRRYQGTLPGSWSTVALTYEVRLPPEGCRSTAGAAKCGPHWLALGGNRDMLGMLIDGRSRWGFIRTQGAKGTLQAPPLPRGEWLRVSQVSTAGDGGRITVEARRMDGSLLWSRQAEGRRCGLVGGMQCFPDRFAFGPRDLLLLDVSFAGNRNPAEGAGGSWRNVRVEARP